MDRTSISTEQLREMQQTQGVTAQEVHHEVQKMDKVLNSENEHLIHIKAVWPFDFFPNEIVVDKTRVTIIQKMFFWTRHVTTLLIQDILNVEVSYSFIFGRLEIADKYYSQDPIMINHLWTNDAKRVASIIQGMVLAYKEQIDIKKIPADVITDKVNDMGYPPAAKDTAMI